MGPTSGRLRPLPHPWSRRRRPAGAAIYFGAGIGAGVVLHDFNVNRWNHHYDRWDSFDHDRGIDGIFGTVILGWDWQHAHTVFGVFVDYDFTDHSSSFHDGPLRRSLSLDSAWSVGARAGWLSNSATLWYLTGGYTEAEVGSSARWTTISRVPTRSTGH